MDTTELKECSSAIHTVAMEFISPGSVRKIVRHPNVDLKAEAESVPFKQGSIAIRSWGEGKPVLLVHGWGVNQSDMFNFIPALLEGGFKAVAMDLPSHGESSGETTDLDNLSDGVLAVGAHLGQLEGLVAHSMGCAASQLAISKGLAVTKVVMLASPHDYEWNLREFAKQRGFDAVQVEQLLQVLCDLGVRMSIRSADFVPGFNMPALIVHSEDDAVIPVSTGKELSDLWKYSQFWKVNGMRHRGLLKDESVIARVIEYLKNESKI